MAARRTCIPSSVGDTERNLEDLPLGACPHLSADEGMSQPRCQPDPKQPCSSAAIGSWNREGKGLSDKEPGWNFHRLRLLGVVHTLPLAMPCALLRVLATSAYLSLAVQGPESLRPSSLLFSCHHWSLAFLSPKTGYEVEYSHPLLPPIPATLGGVEVQRATSLPL